MKKLIALLLKLITTGSDIVQRLDQIIELLEQQQQPKVKAKPKSSAPLYTEEFEKAWKLWPRKVGKKNAAKAWNTAVKTQKRNKVENPIADLLTRITKYVNTTWPEHRRSPNDLKFCPHFASYLNGERYLDEVIEAGTNDGLGGQVIPCPDW